MHADGHAREALNRLVGERVRYAGEEWRVTEVLHDGPCVILEALGAGPSVQADQFGEARRRAPRRTSVPIYAGDGRTLHAEFLSIQRVTE